MAERRARLRIRSRMTSPEGEAQEMRRARTGTVLREGETVTLAYDDEQDGERARILLEARPGFARMRRAGMIRAELAFAPGERRAGLYETPYGDIPVATDTRSVTLAPDADGGTLLLCYDVYAGGERTASARLEIAWRC